ncbi:MAG TPA: hypothetical protein VGR55_00550 [Candidatus Acidoferrum sp.]|nr:hypothetical protein [Candidatus Acidoferrum sp.]
MSTIPTKRCFTRRHLKITETALYDYMLAISRRDGEFRSDARRDAWDLGVNKDSITAWTKSLVKKGWLIETQKPGRDPKTGRKTCAHYQVLTHAEWVEKHGSESCRDLKDYRAQQSAHLSDETGQESPDHLSDETGQEPNNHLSETVSATCPKPPVSPVRPDRTKKSIKKENTDATADGNNTDHHVAAVTRVWNYYIHKMKKDPYVLSLTPRRLKLGLLRLKEATKKIEEATGRVSDLEGGERLMTIAIDALAMSAFHMGHNEQKKAYNSWETNLFVSKDKFEWWLDKVVRRTP